MCPWKGGEQEAAKAPYFSDHVLKYLLEHYDQSLVRRRAEGVHYLDLSWQEAAGKSFAQGISPNGPVVIKLGSPPQGALIALRSHRMRYPSHGWRQGNR